MRAFDEVSNVAVEHENYSTKQKGKLVCASMRLDTAAQTMNSHSQHRNFVKAAKAANSLNSRPTWSDSSTAKYITPYAEGVLGGQWIVRNNYFSARVSRSKWYVRHKDQNAPFDPEHPQTKFIRV